jgi:nucleotide-binding universal stress UspA family protein
VTLVVGYPPDGRRRAVLHLAGMLARSSRDDLVLCAVIPAPWPPGPARVDAEYQEHLERETREALERARERIGDDVEVATHVHHARSVPAGLLEVVEERDAAVLVTGAFGSTVNRLLHSSHVPVAVAPHGFRAPPGARVERVTAAFGGSDDQLVVAAGSVAARVGATLRLASFAVRPRAPYTVAVGREADASAVAQWVDEIRAAQQAALDRVSALPEVPSECEAVVGRGEDWEDALDDVDWGGPGDVLVVGSSAVGPVARVFLGSRSEKIVQHSPVPVVVVPRGVAAELADEAASAA